MRGRIGSLTRLGNFVAAVCFLSASWGCASWLGSTPKEEAGAKPVVRPVEQKVVQTVPTLQAPYYPAPTTMELCGEPAPLNMPEVYERFDKEFTLIVYNNAQVYLWLKRMERWFPMIEERLRQMGLPDDLKWVAIVESDLVPNVVSPKGAAGPWQFMPSTGSAYGLDQRGSVDKRYDFERATDGAFMYLSDLYKRYRNWSLAIAAYNCGEGRIQNESRSQGTRDYYCMRLPQETERYVMRILAVKAVLGNPGLYGYDLPKGLGYQELKLDRIRVNFTRPTSIQTVANCADVTVREFKRLNPVFRSDDVPSGTHEIKLPNGFGKVFEANFRSGATRETIPAAPVASASLKEDTDTDPMPSAPPVSTAKPVRQQAKAQPVKLKTYTVKRGDTLSGIASRFDVSTNELKTANKLRSSDIMPGQQLKIP